MALFEEALEGGVGPGLAIVGAVMLAPTVLPAVGRMLRPAAKTVTKAGIMLYRQALSGVGEATGGLMDEVRAELAAEGHGKTGGSTGSSSSARSTVGTAH